MATGKKKRNGDALMKFQKQKNFKDRQKKAAEKIRKKKRDRLRWLQKKETKKSLSQAEKKEKRILQKSL